MRRNDWFLNDLVTCGVCGEIIWFSPEGYIKCSCGDSEKRQTPAWDIEAAVVWDITEKLLNDEIFAERITKATNEALAAQNRPGLTRPQIVSSLKEQYEKIFSSHNSVDKRNLATTLIGKITLFPEQVLEIEYRNI